MKKILFILMVSISVSSVRAGTVLGTVRAEGKTAGAADDTGGAYASRKYKFAERVDYSAMHDFVVYIKGPIGTNILVPSSNHVVVNTTRIKQEGAVFDPHVLPVTAGTTV